MEVKETIIYTVGGEDFRDKEAAEEYRALCEDVDRIMSRLAPLTEKVKKGLDYLRHDVNTVRSVKDELLEYCNNLIPQGREKLKLTNKEVDIERPLRWNLDKLCLRKAWYRLWRICSHTGYEFYRTNFSNDVINALEKSIAQVGERKEYESRQIPAVDIE
jgi:hypothetical protein